MHIFRTIAILSATACLAQAVAAPGYGRNGNGDGNGVQRNQDNGNDNGQNRSNDNGNGNDGQYNGQQQRHRYGNQQGDDRNSTNRDRNQGNDQQGQVTVTVTTQIAAANTLPPLTVMTVTVTAPCTVDPNAVSTSVIAAPTASVDPAAQAVTTARKFVTPAAEISNGLSSLPVAVASALGADPNAVVAGSAPPSVNPGNFATLLGSSGFPGLTFTTSGSVTPGKTSVPVGAALPSGL